MARRHRQTMPRGLFRDPTYDENGRIMERTAPVSGPTDDARRRGAFRRSIEDRAEDRRLADSLRDW